MALHSTLPIFKVAYDLLDVAVDLVRNMPRDVKSVIGGEIRDGCLKITVLIFRANTRRDKVPHLLELIERVQKIELLLRLARDKHYIATGQYAKAVKLTDNIGRQANGWRKQSAASPVT